jgi:endonuclease/exonuclease/phosphatase family metal-dependent hydrolase
VQKLDGFFRNVFYLFLLVTIEILTIACAPAIHNENPIKSKDTLRILSFNILYGGDEFDFSKTIEAIRLADADIVGLQEAEGNTEKLAKALNYPYFDSKLHLLSRFPLIRSVSNGWYYTYVETSPGEVFSIFNIHLPSDPYGPELARDGMPTDSVYINELRTRFHELDIHRKHFAELQSQGISIILTGDFNAPSHIDWSADLVGIRPHLKYAFEWPVSKNLELLGFVDAYRAVFPNPKTKQGLTWTPGFPSPKINPRETHDRIDFIWTRGEEKIIDTKILGEMNGPDVDLSVNPFPSDHRGVIIDCVIQSKPAPNYIQTKNRILNFDDSIDLNYNSNLKESLNIILKDSSGRIIFSINNVSSSNNLIHVNIPDQCVGKIQVQLLCKDSIIALSDFWRLEAVKFQPTLLVTKNIFLVNEPITVNWKSSPGDRFDWIAVYPQMANTKSDYGLTHQQSHYLIYKYTMSEVSGSLSLDSLSKGDHWPLPAGEYQIHLLSDDGFTSLDNKSIRILD